MKSYREQEAQQAELRKECMDKAILAASRNAGMAMFVGGGTHAGLQYFSHAYKHKFNTGAKAAFVVRTATSQYSIGKHCMALETQHHSRFCNAAHVPGSLVPDTQAMPVFWAWFYTAEKVIGRCNQAAWQLKWGMERLPTKRSG